MIVRSMAIMLAASVVLTCRASAQPDTLNKANIEILAGASVPTSNVYEDDDMNIAGFNGSIRLLWDPGRRLSVGLEGGLLHLAHSKDDYIDTEFGRTKRANSLNAYPLMLHFRMRIWKIELMLGLGAALVASKIVAFDDVSLSTVITSSKLYGVGYSLALTDRLTLGCEFKYYSFSSPELTVASIQARAVYTLMVW